jgi:hypothetical protein
MIDVIRVPPYVAGADSRVALALQRILSTRTMDALMCRATGIHEHPPTSQ